MVHQFFQAKMSSLPSMSLSSQRYLSPEGTPPLSPYHVFNDGYSSNMSSEHVHCAYSSQPGSPLYMPDTPSSSQNLGWSNQGQDYGSPIVQHIMYDDASTQFDNFGANCGQYQHSGYSHHLNVDPAMSSPVLDFFGQNLHINMRGLNMFGSQESGLTSPVEHNSPVAFQTGSELYSPHGAGSSPPFMPGCQSTWPSATAYMPLTPPFQATSLSRTWEQSSALTTAPVIPEGRYRKLNASSSCSASSLCVVNRPAIQTRRRQKKDKSLRIFKCETPGCFKNFNRPYNARKHRDVVHGNPAKNEKCPLPGCDRSIEGFNRKHDLDRHVISVRASCFKFRGF